MFELRETATFTRWLKRLTDVRARTAIVARLNRLEYGHVGDAKPVGDGISELRIHFGPGYRVYFQRRGSQVILLLCGGDKGSQDRDIAAAKVLARSWSE
jgi:putative addiction module killer protein